MPKRFSCLDIVAQLDEDRGGHEILFLIASSRSSLVWHSLLQWSAH